MSGHWLAELDGSSVTVEVPGSSANLGADYDSLGVALAIVNRIEVEVRVWSRGAIELIVEGEGRRRAPRRSGKPVRSRPGGHLACGSGRAA